MSSKRLWDNRERTSWGSVTRTDWGAEGTVVESLSEGPIDEDGTCVM